MDSFKSMGSSDDKWKRSDVWFAVGTISGKIVRDLKELRRREEIVERMKRPVEPESPTGSFHQEGFASGRRRTVGNGPLPGEARNLGEAGVVKRIKPTPAPTAAGNSESGETNTGGN